MTQFLAVYGDDLPLGYLENGLHPGDEARLELLWVETRKYPAKGIVRGDTVFQVYEATQPTLFAFTKRFNISPSLSASYDSAKSDGDNVGV